jgi:hypothetical protein
VHPSHQHRRTPARVNSARPMAGASACGIDAGSGLNFNLGRKKDRLPS